MYTVTQLAKAAEAEGLQWPKKAKDGRYNTMNERGAMNWKIYQGDEMFIEIALKPKAKVLEIGAAHGLVCLEALRRGANNYVVNDMEIKHLKILARRVADEMPETAKSLNLVLGEFPYQNLVKRFAQNSFDAILINNVLHFFTEKEVKESFRQFARLLKPGGKLIATMLSHDVAFLKKDVRDRFDRELDNFLNAPDEKKAKMVVPCFVGKTGDAFDLTEKVLDEIGLTTRVNMSLFDPLVLKYLLEKERFNIEKIDFYALDSFWKGDDDPKQIVLVAQKPEFGKILINVSNISGSG